MVEPCPDNSLDCQRLPDSQRLDVFLYRTRLLKTRGLAAKMVTGRKIRLTRAGTTTKAKKAHTSVRPGDGISFMRGKTLLTLTVDALPERRGPAVEARACYTLITDGQSDTRMGDTVDKTRASRQSALVSNKPTHE